LGDEEGHNTRNGERFFELFEEGTWRRPGNKNYIYIYLLNYLIFLKLMIQLKSLKFVHF